MGQVLRCVRGRTRSALCCCVDTKERAGRMIRGMEQAQAQYDAMEPPDYYEPDIEAVEDDDPDDENERRAEWAREDNE